MVLPTSSEPQENLNLPLPNKINSSVSSLLPFLLSLVESLLLLPEENKMSRLVPPLLVVLLLVSLVLEPTGLLRSGEENKMNNLVLSLVSVSELSQVFLTEPQVLSTPPEVDKISLSHLKNRILALDSPADSTLHSVVPKVDSVGARINNKS
jgi:hypothetical protein